jgi:peptidoglycan hydrolase-like protein with peptidoglycan-binding domain
VVPTAPWRAAAIRLAAAATLSSACHGPDAESGRAAAEAMQRSFVDIDGPALAQPVDAKTVADVQRQLAVLNEYQGAVDGQIDAVLVNAIQAFQRTAGLKDDGLLTTETLRRLAQAAAAATPSISVGRAAR